MEFGYYRRKNSFYAVLGERVWFLLAMGPIEITSEVYPMVSASGKEYRPKRKRLGRKVKANELLLEKSKDIEV